MVHYLIGDLGHLFVTIAFVSALFSTFLFYKATINSQLANNGAQWEANAIIAFYIHVVAVLGIVISLFLIIFNHYFEYHYAWSHSSLHLPSYYMVSAFWEGQEGSFLLWIFWHAILGFILIRTNRKWRPSMMTIYSAVQAFLVSMILGVIFFDFKLGSSPFLLLRDVLDEAIFKTNPDFIPTDGTGLNPLLQNYWMVIHPPTLFLGFATTLVPFSYCMAGLWQKQYREWIRPALPWSIFSAAVLGLGVLMGGYWAYETLNFGGYWNWDPVENAVYVPWLVLIAAIHTMITFRNSDTALKTSIILVISTFILILYSTFLTRSGILGDTSVHSFTDLGLSGQLLLYLLVFLILSIVLAIFRWKEIPSSEREISTYSREFWIFIGATTLCLMGFQVLIPTSIPVFNSIVELFGGISKTAPPTDPVAFYSKFQLWFAVLVAGLSGAGQFFWWKKMDKEKLKSELLPPLAISLLISAGIIAIAKITHVPYMVITLSGVFSIVASIKILIGLKKESFKLSGGAISHIGIAMMLLGIMASSGYSNIVSLNKSGLLISNDLDDDFNLENLILFLSEPRQMGDATLIYKGQRLEAKEFDGYVNKKDVKLTNDPFKVLVNKDVLDKNGHTFKKGDTLTISPENTFYEISYIDKSGEEISLFPRAQMNEAMGGQLASPDIKRGLFKDLYTHIWPLQDPNAPKEWSDTEEFKTKLNEQFFANDFVSKITKVQRIDEVDGLELSDDDVAIKANIEIMGADKTHIAEPIYLIKNKLVGRIPFFVDELGIKFTLMGIEPETGQFSIGINTTQKDFVILKAIEKPLINVLWLGTLILMIGFGIALYRRYTEFIMMRDKEME